MINIAGKIQSYDGQMLTIVAPFTDDYILQKQDIENVEISLSDNRSISVIQRRKIFALVSDIADYATDVRGSKKRREEQEILRQLQLLYLIDTSDTEAVRKQLTDKFCDLIGADLFSLSDIDMSTAREFIDWLVALCVEYDIPCNDTLLNRCEDVERYLYMCVAKRRCAVCGAKADIHEVERVGMGRNRAKMHHLGQEIQPLCRLHHCEAHNIGQKTFDKKYQIGTIRLDEHLCRAIGWKI